VDAARTEGPYGRRTLLLAIAAGGVVGAESRVGVSHLLERGASGPGPGAWPWDTLAVNVSGCFLVAVLMVAVGGPASQQGRTVRRGFAHPLARPFLGVGVLGGFTTFSAYAVEVRTLAVDGQPALAALYAVLSVAAGLVAVVLGLAAGRALVRHR
jgi:CrcB protein